MNEDSTELYLHRLHAIKCNNIYADSLNSPISGLIIFSTKFEKIIDFAQCSESAKNEFLQAYTVIDYSDSYIFPGVIDMNVHLNSGFNEAEWENIEDFTKMAVQGGITTIVDNPLMSSYNEKFDELESLMNRIEVLKHKIYTDCGLFAYIGRHNVSRLEEIHNAKIALGYKVHLMRTWQPDLPFMSPKALRELFVSIKDTSKFDGILLAFHFVFANDKDMFMCSPMKSENKATRFHGEMAIKKSDFRGGLAEDLDSLSVEDDPKNQYLLDEEIDDWIEERNEKGNGSNLPPQKQKLEIQARIIAKFQEENSIARMELFQYNSQESPLLEQSSSSENASHDLSEENSDLLEQQHSPSIERSIGTNQNIKGEFVKIQLPGSQQNLPTKKIAPKLNLTKQERQVSTREIQPEEEIKTAGAISRRESIKKNQGISNIIRKRGFNTLSVQSEHSFEKIQSLNSISSFEAIKLHELKTDHKTTKDKENMINHSYEMYHSNHLLFWEVRGLRRILKKTEQVFRESKSHKAKLLFMNISSNSLLFQINRVKESQFLRDKVDLFTEVCSPYFFFYNTKIKESQTKYKVSPPIRIKKERDLFLQTIKQEGLIDIISAYHFGVPWKYKFIDQGNFRRSFEGLSSLGFNLQVLWTKLFLGTQKASSKDQAIKLILVNENMQSKALKIEHETYQKLMKLLVSKLCENPAKVLNLENKKGRIAVGLDADFVVWNPFKEYRVKGKDLPMKEKNNFIWLNCHFYGEVHETYLRGDVVFRRNEKPPHFYKQTGELLLREW